MNNDLEQFSEEKLKDMQKNVTAGMTLGHADALLIRQAICIALASKQAVPAGYLENGKGFMYEPRHKDLIKNPTPVYTNPQPTHTEQDGWIKCSEQMPEVGDVVLTAYQGATNVGEMERSGRDYRYFTSIASGRELPTDFWMPLPAAPKPESE